MTEAEDSLRREIEGKTQDLYDFLVRRARSIVGPGDALDLVQDAWVRALQKADTLREPAAFGAWIARVVENLCVDFVRGQNGSVRIVRLQDQAVADFATDADPAPNITEREESAYRMFRTALLPEGCRNFVVGCQFCASRDDLRARFEMKGNMVNRKIQDARDRLSQQPSSAALARFHRSFTFYEMLGMTTDAWISAFKNPKTRNKLKGWEETYALFHFYFLDKYIESIDRVLAFKQQYVDRGMLLSRSVFEVEASQSLSEDIIISLQFIQS